MPIMHTVHRIQSMLLYRNEGLVTQSLHHKDGLREQNRKIADLLQGIKRRNRFIESDSLLEDQNIGVALIEYFF